MIGLSGLLYLGIIALEGQNASNLETKQIFLDSYKKNLEVWYQSNAWVIDNDTTGVLPLASIPTESTAPMDLVIVPSTRIRCLNNTGADIFGHKILLIVPKAMGSISTEYSSFSSTGTFTQGANDLVAVVDGCQIELDIFLNSRDRINELGKIAENYFKVLYKQDVYLTGGNYFLSNTCESSVGTGAMPCVDWTNGDQSNINTKAATLWTQFGAVYTKDLYGNDIIFENHSTGTTSHNGTVYTTGGVASTCNSYPSNYNCGPPYTVRFGFKQAGNTLPTWINAVGSN